MLQCYKSYIKGLLFLIFIIITICSRIFAQENDLNNDLKPNNKINFYIDGNLKIATNTSFSYEVGGNDYFAISAEADLSVRYNYSTDPLRVIQVFLFNRSEYENFVASEDPAIGI